MFEDLGLENWTPVEASLALGAIIGVLFGALAQRSRFCLRRGLAGESAQTRASALATWLTALAVATLGMALAASAGLIDLSETRFAAETIALGPLVAGGLMFGIGMVLTRGCASRLTVLAASGNMRAAACMLVFAIAAHATLKGALHRVPDLFAGGEFTPASPLLDAATGIPAYGFAALFALGAAFAAFRGKARPADLVMGALIGLLVPAGWVGTGYVLLDEFDPIAMESLAFTSHGADTLFWTVASTAIPADFSVGFIGGVLGGAFLAAAGFGELKFETFSAPAQTGRYMAGAVLMGVGGVMAGGCTVGAGLAGIPSMGIAAPIALLSIIAGGLLARGALGLSAGQGGAAAIPAE